MSKEIKVRWGWLRAMYIYTIAGAGGFGLAIIFATYIIGDLIAIPFDSKNHPSSGILHLQRRVVMKRKDLVPVRH